MGLFTWTICKRREQRRGFCVSHFRNPALLHLSLWRDVSIMDWHIPLQDYPALPRRTPAVKRNTSLLTSVRAAFHPVTGTRPAVFLNLSRSERVPRVTRWHSGSAMGFAARSQVLIINHTEIKPSDAVFYSPEPPVCFLHKSPMQRGFAAITRSVIKSVVLLRQRKIGRQFTEPQTALYINNASKITKTPSSAIPLSSMQCFSIFQLIVLAL